MKCILIACKGITEECEILQDSPGLSDEDFDSIRDAKDILSESLTNLMTVTKEHASSNTLKNSDAIQEKLKKLSYSVSDMVELIRLVVSSKQMSAKTPDTPKLATKSKEVLNKRQSFIDKEDPPPMDMTDLRYYLEDNTDDIAHAIQDLLQSMRNTSALPEDVKKLLLNVQTIVDNIIFETRLTLSEFTVNKSVKDECEQVLELLESDYEKLGQMAKDVNDRNVKQQIANSSYEVAKVLFNFIV
jgi:predicted RND superfamily exporter protein